MSRIHRPAAICVAMGVSWRHSACVIHAAQLEFARQLYTSARTNWFWGGRPVQCAHTFQRSFQNWD